MTCSREIDGFVMNIYFAGAVCEGWVCGTGAIVIFILLFLLFVVILGAPVYLLYKYCMLYKHKHLKEAAAIRRRIRKVLIATIVIFVVGTIINQIYLRVKG